MPLYKGYAWGDGKHAATKIKDTALLKWATVRNSSGKSYVGILNDDVIMVDVDSLTAAKKLKTVLDAEHANFAALRTDKGMHFYFQDYQLTTNKIGWYSAIGIKADYKLGIKNTADPLKIDGKARKWIVQSDSLDPLPFWLTPINNHTNGIADIEQGDRNQKLFNYILTLQKHGLSKDEIQKTIRLINKFILERSLPESEVKTILRDDSFIKQSFYTPKGKFLHDSFGDYLIKEEHVIQINKQLHIYVNGVYSSDQNDIERAMLKQIKSLNTSQRKEVINYLLLQAPEKHFSDSRYIILGNGIYDLKTDTLQGFTPDIIVANKIPVDYVPGAYYEPTDRTLDKVTCGDKNLRAVLEEVFGTVMYRRNVYSKAFILTGDGGHGKSSILSMIEKFVGKEKNTSAIELKDLSDRFKPAALFGKLANIGDDISNEYIKDNATFKKLVTGETVVIESKGKDPFQFDNYATLVFSANKVPHINDHSNGLTRRLMFIPFEAEFKDTDPDFDRYIDDKLQSKESLQYVLILGLQALKRMKKQDGYTMAKGSELQLAQYTRDNEPILAYLDEEQPKFINETTKNCYLAYAVWCTDNGHKPMNQQSLTRFICDKYGYESKPQTIDGKKKRVYIEK